MERIKYTCQEDEVLVCKCCGKFSTDTANFSDECLANIELCYRDGLVLQQEHVTEMVRKEPVKNIALNAVNSVLTGAHRLVNTKLAN